MKTRSQARSRADQSVGPRRPAIYCRISEAADDLGVKRQEKHCRRLGERRGWTLAHARIYIDNDITAARKNGELPERPDFDRLRADIQAGEVDGVLAYDLDRLLRDPFEAEQFYLVAEQAGMYRILTEADDVDISTGHGLMVARIKAAVAAEEVRKIRQRVAAKKLERAEKGLPAGGGRRAFGWSCHPRVREPKCTRRRCPHDETCRARLEERAKPCAIPGCAHDRGMSLVEAEADGLRRAAVMILDGSTLEAAATMLDEAGLPATPGQKWDPKVLSRVLKSPRMVARRQHQGEIIGDAAWPAILDTKTWQRVRDELGRRQHFVAPYREHLLGGVARCKCEAKLYAQVTTRHGEKGPVVYSCKKERGGCGGVSIVADRLEERVVTEVGSWFATKEMADRITALIVGDEVDEVAELEAEVLAAEERLRAIAREREELGLDWVEVEESRRVVKARLETARSKLSAARRRAAVRSPLGQVTVEEIAEAWAGGDPATRREIIAALARVTVRSVGKRWRSGVGGYESPERVEVLPVWSQAA